MTAPGGCGGHAGLGEELRAAVLAALDRIDPALDRLRTDPGCSASPDAAATCASCPVCAVIAALRGERPELAVRLAEHAAGLVAVLRTALEEGAAGTGQSAAGRPADPPDPTAEQAPARRVQRISVERTTP